MIREYRWYIRFRMETDFLFVNYKNNIYALCAKGKRKMELYEKVSTNLGFVEREKKIRKFWEENRVFEKCDFSDKIMCEFEGFSFPIPIGFDRLLRVMYGDYKILPPENERGAWHSGAVFEPDVPYKEYLKKMDRETCLLKGI